MFEHTNTNPLECYGNMLTSKVHSEVQPFAHGGHQPQKFGTRIWKYILQAMYIQMNLCVLENVFILQHKNTSCKWHTRNLQCKRHVDRCSSFLKNAQKISWHRRRWEFATWKYIKKSIQYICPISTSIVLYETKRIKMWPWQLHCCSWIFNKTITGKGRRSWPNGCFFPHLLFRAVLKIENGWSLIC